MKLLVKILFSLLLFFFSAQNALASNEFFIDSDVEYNFLENGVAQVNYRISIENKFATMSPKAFSLSLKKINVENLKGSSLGKSVSTEKVVENDITKIDINLSDSNLGRGKKTEFQIAFDTKSLTQNTGEVWEISLPKLDNADEYRNYSVTFVVPQTFGNRAYVSPTPVSNYEKEGKRIYSFNKESVSANPILAAFGDFQVFNFTLKYHLENPLITNSITQISIPPDTNFQKIYLESVNPRPKNTYVDIDGNWIAEFAMKPREKVDVEVVGTAQLFLESIKINEPSQEYLNMLLLPDEYWEVADGKIIGIANSLNNARSIYDYVVNFLDYDYSRVKPNVERLGALKTLTNPKSAICMEYTDLYVALSRAKGFPTREVNGFAYSENPEIEPISLVADVLHSWVEYYDSKLGEWVTVDPTWGDTTGGIDFFAKNDLKHFAFTYHGVSSTRPYPPGSYKFGDDPQKDVYVNFGKLPTMKGSVIQISTENKGGFLFFNRRLNVILENNGNSAVYDVEPKIIFGKKNIPLEKIDVIPPYGRVEQLAEVPFNLFGIKNPENIVIVAKETTYQLPSNKMQIIILSLIAFLSLFLVLITYVFIRFKKDLILKYLGSGKTQKTQNRQKNL